MVPFDYINNFIIVEVKLDNFLRMKFLVDTGAQHTLITDKRIAFLLGLDYVREFRIVGADMKRELIARLVSGVNIEIGDLLVENLPVLVLDEDYYLFDEMTGEEIHGIIGGNFLRRFVLEINYFREKLIFHNPTYFKKNNPKYEIYPISIDSHKPYINSDLFLSNADSSINTKLLLDSGAGVALLLDIESNNEITIPEVAIPGNIGGGLGGDLIGYLGLVDKLKFGSFDMRNVPTNFQVIENDTIEVNDNDRDGLIGNQILDRFNLIIDYHRDKLYLQPNKRFKKGFRINKSGLSVIASGDNLNKYIVQDVLIESPASKAGMLSGDKILSINRIPYFFLSMKRINKLLSRKEGRKLNIRIKRKDKKMKFNFRLENLFQKKSTN